MTRTNLWLAAGLLAMLGCTEEAHVPSKDTTTPVSPAPATPGTTPATAPAPAGEKAAAEGKLDADEVAAIEKLPEADRAAALAQKTCPVSGEHLGSMGTPLKVSADGKSAFLCCKGCNSDFEADPKAVFAKLGK